MNIHKNARLTPIGRERLVGLVESGQTPETAARRAGVCPRTVRKWLARFRAESVAGLQDRSSRPHRLHRPTPASTVERIETLRRQRFTGQQIARDLGVSPATVSRVLRRLGLNGIAALEPAEPVRRYERERPGELIHIDIKKLGRFERTGHRITGDRTGQSKSRGRLGVPPPGRRRPFPAGLFGDLARREARLLPHLPVQRPAVLPAACHRGRKGDDRQRFGLQIPPLRQGAAPARHQAQAHPALHAQDQRQGRALRADIASGMGVRQTLRDIGSATP